MALDPKQLGSSMAGLTDMVQMEIQQYAVKRTGKRGKFAGRNCQYFNRKMVVVTNMSGVMSQKQTINDKICMDKSIRLQVPTAARDLAQGMFASPNNRKVMKQMMAAEKQLNGVVLYQKSVHQMDMKMEGALGAIPGMGDAMKAAENMETETKTVSVKSTGLPAKVFQVPLKDFLPPKREGKKKSSKRMAH